MPKEKKKHDLLIDVKFIFLVEFILNNFILSFKFF